VIAFLAHFLIVLAAWTVTIKFLFPVAYALGEGVPIATYIYLDFWWVVHLWLAWALLRWQPYTYALAIGVSTVEIAIIVTKFALFLPDPEWTIWTTNWFINKLFVLACFGLMLPYLVLYRPRRGGRTVAAPSPERARASPEMSKSDNPDPVPARAPRHGSFLDHSARRPN
jgi:hypothetical protein